MTVWESVAPAALQAPVLIVFVPETAPPAQLASQALSVDVRMAVCAFLRARAVLTGHNLFHGQSKDLAP